MTPDPELLAIGREIARIRNARGISQERLAENAGVHRNYVGLVERGERNPTLKVLVAITAALDFSLAELLTTVCSADAELTPSVRP